MRNSIHFIKDEKEITLSDNNHMVIIDGELYQNEPELLTHIGKSYNMPDYHNWDAINDWFRDLSWIPLEDQIIVIKNFDLLLINNRKSKSSFLRILSERVLPHWEEGSDAGEYYGKKMDFQVYIIM